MPPSKADKMQQQAVAKKIEDKTFGMKNKNKSKQVQKQIAQMKHTAGVGRDEHKDNADKKAAAANAAVMDVLFKEAVTKKELARRALEKAAAKEKKEKEKEKEPEKRDIFTDSRDKSGNDEDTMATWDEEQLRKVVDQKKGGQGERCKTDIICKHFLDAVERRTYGWFWECPNGGDKCQYRHALPEGYVLKRDKVDEVVDQGPTVEDLIEEKRKALGPVRTPVTFERLQEWLEKKKARIAEEEAAKLDAARKAYAKGKSAGVTGRMLFEIDSSLFVDDAGGMAETYGREASDDEEDGDAVAAEAPKGPPPGYVPPAPTPPAPIPAASSAAATTVDLSGPAGTQPAAPQCAACAATAAGGSDGSTYAQNYVAEGAGGGAAAGAADGSGGGVAAAAVDVSDLAGVDESLFLDEDLPDDDDLE